MSGGIIWELDPSGYWVRRGDRPAILIPWGEVRSLVAVGSSAPYSTVLMKLVDQTGKTRANLVSGYLMGVESIRTIYEAAAYYLKDSGVTVRNNLGWRPTLPESVATEVRGERPRFLLHFVFSLLVAGGLIVATGSFEGQATPISFGVGLILIATILLAMDRIRHRNRKYRNEGGSG